jgi:aminoglycoside phosphotransferase (APT) family kinase protein
MNDWIDEIESRVNALLRTGIVKEPSDRLTVTSAARGCCLGDRVSLVHRDLTVKNMLFADSLQGVVDWADARMGHPAIDLEIVYLFLPASCRAVFWTHYGEVPSAWRALARLRALYRTGFWISAPEYQTDPAFRKEARQALQFALESRC